MSGILARAQQVMAQQGQAPAQAAPDGVDPARLRAALGMMDGGQPSGPTLDRGPARPIQRPARPEPMPGSMTKGKPTLRPMGGY
jgi:hypothetical protein